MNKFKLTILLMIFVLGTAAVNAQDSKPRVAITLERTACFGTCPVYSITIYDNGDVVFDGKNFVPMMGEQKSQLDPATVAIMVKAFDNAGYFGWKGNYDQQIVTDLPSAITSVTLNGKTQRIVHYAGDHSAPLALPFLEQWIDDMTGSSVWTGAQANIAGISNDGHAPLITLQRGACFGTCPVYSVALYEDGTIVRTGIAHVDTMGVSVLKADAAVVSSIVQQATALGYFDWQDSYDKQVKTDQSTVTTSVQTPDQTKQIVRYNGDPNAPVGLVWIEDSIDQVVTSAVG